MAGSWVGMAVPGLPLMIPPVFFFIAGLCAFIGVATSPPPPKDGVP
jgi:hypothetical protein